MIYINTFSTSNQRLQRRCLVNGNWYSFYIKDRLSPECNLEIYRVCTLSISSDLLHLRLRIYKELCVTLEMRNVIISDSFKCLEKLLVRSNGTTLFAMLALECEFKKSTIFNVDGMSMLLSC